MNKCLITNELIKIAKLITGFGIKVDVLDETGDRRLGITSLSLEEVRHFTSTKSFPAKLALDSETISRLGIDDDTHIRIVKASKT